LFIWKIVVFLHLKRLKSDGVLSAKSLYSNNKKRLEMNRKKGIIVSIMLLAFMYAQGQDKIITVQNDTIFCKIVSISLKLIKYEQQDYTYETVAKFIPMEQVREYSLNSQSQKSSFTISNRKQSTTPPPAYPNRQQKPQPYYTPVKQMENSFPHWRFGLQGGGSYIFKSPTDMGLHAGADLYYLATKSFGVGFKYSLYAFSKQTDDYIYDNSLSDPTYYCVSKDERTYMNYIGPSVVFLQWLDENHTLRLNEELSVGYLYYRNEVRFDQNQYAPINPDLNKPEYNYLEEVNTLGGSFQLSLEYYPEPWFSFGVNAGIGMAPLTVMKITDKETSVPRLINTWDYFKKSHIDCSIGFRFYF